MGDWKTNSSKGVEEQDIWFAEYREQRAIELSTAKQRQASSDHVPFRLSKKLQVWIPTELSVIARTLWDEVSGQSNEDDPDVRVWCLFLGAIFRTRPISATTGGNTSTSLSPASRLYLLRLVYDKILNELAGNDIHAVTTGWEDQEQAVADYFSVWEEELAVAMPLFGAKMIDPYSSGHRSAILQMVRKNECGLLAVFGGQGVQWLPELQMMYTTYPFVRQVIGRASTLLSNIRGWIPDAFGRIPLDLLSWIAGDSVPSEEFLSRAVLSYPMIGLTQLVNWLITVRLWNIPPAAALKAFQLGVGHSQGVVAACVMFCSETLESLEDNIVMAVAILFLIGARLQERAKISMNVSPDVLHECRKSGWGVPSPMVAIFHLTEEVLRRYIDVVNKSVEADGEDWRIELSLYNGSRAFVVTGAPESLYKLLVLLHRNELPRSKKVDQSRIPYSKRKREFSFTFLPVSVPFHSKLLNPASVVNVILDDLKENIPDAFQKLSATALKRPVLSTFDGSNLQQQPSLLEELVRLQCIEHVNWAKCITEARKIGNITHLVDFGPGGRSGIGVMTGRDLNGAGVQVVLAGNMDSSPNHVGKHVLFDNRVDKIPFGRNWAVEYAPKLVKRRSDGMLLVDTKFTRLVGKPPVMMAGMTPTTVNHSIVAAALNAGYHGELAGGGLPSEAMFRERIESLLRETEHGNGVTINLLFLNQRLWGFQYPMCLSLAKEGFPIEGFTVAAGVPSLERATEILAGAREAGILHVSFKPGSAGSILQVVEIARNNPDSNVILQWTGGRGGGHHSFEDFHQPILETYAAIRSCSNIVLVGGSGFGSAVDSWPYMTGEWSVKFGCAPMPYDAILMGSRFMVAKEARTAYEAKELIVRTPGISRDAEWEKSYDSDAGGIMTVMSELGEPIHKIATRGLRVWRDFDKQFFSLPLGEKRTQKILEKKSYIIKALNTDFQRVFFGKNLNGDVVDLESMTYEEVVTRMIHLMVVQPKPSERVKEGAFPEWSADSPAQWIHESFLERVFLFGKRIEERFTSNRQPFSANQSLLPPRDVLEVTPQEWVAQLFSGTFKEASTQLLCSEDVDYFVSLCRRRGMKPVTFIPVIDGDLEFWFKKDSLWQSEYLEAVPDHDVGRVIILQGPMAAYHSTKLNEPVSSIFEGIHRTWIDYLIPEYKNRGQDIPVCEYLAMSEPAPINWSQLRFKTNHKIALNELASSKYSPEKESESSVPKKAIRVTLPSDEADLPSSDDWFEWLAQPSKSWWRALLTVKHIVRDVRQVPNHIRKLLAPRPGISVTLYFATEVLHLDTSGFGVHDLVRVTVQEPEQEDPVVDIRQDLDGSIGVNLFHRRPATSFVSSRLVPLSFQFMYKPALAPLCIHENTVGRNQRIKNFYAQLWFSDDASASNIHELDAQNPEDLVLSNTFNVTRESIEKFCRSVGRTPRQHTRNPAEIVAPVDYAIVVCWKSLIRPLFLSAVDGDILQLVHLENAFDRTIVEENVVIMDKSVVESEMRINSIETTDSGQVVEIKGTVYVVQESEDGGNPVKTPYVEITTKFLFRTPTPFKCNFFRRERERVLVLKTEEDLKILLSKTWLSLHENTELKVGDVLISRTSSLQKKNAQPGKSLFSIRVSGLLTDFASGAEVATLKYEGEMVHGDPIITYFERRASPRHEKKFFNTGGYRMLTTAHTSLAPSENHTYATASGDLNPIHTNIFFSDLADLPTTIVHGMWSSANAWNAVEGVAAKSQPDRILGFNCKFMGMVHPRDKLSTVVKHVGMCNGKMLIKVESFTPESSSPVLRGEAIIRSPKTAYVFTGQGSAEVGMGMDLYKKSEVARKAWDRADTYFLAQYGISILQIVRENPKEIIIHFGGLNGARIRRNFQSLTQSVHVNGSSEIAQVPVFPEINDQSTSYRFSHEEGLLFATQFSQPALVLMELTAYLDMGEHGLISPDCIFTGHSLGEYAALASVARVLSVENLVEIVFLRGMTMQNAVQRDENGRSNFAMVAVNPMRVHPRKFKEKELHHLIDSISTHTDKLLQVVNYNILNYQYVVAGHRDCLYVLYVVLSKLHQDLDNGMANLDKLTQFAFAAAEEARDPSTGRVPLERGIASIPLPGIDVPFHSRFLKNGVPAFRDILRSRMDRDSIVPEILVGRYIPNVVAEPLQLTKDYVQLVYDSTGSDLLKEILADFDTAAKDRVTLSFNLIMELLAYQFASPVRWIETQQQFFEKLGVERIIEVGPAPTLVTMAKRTLETGGFSPLVDIELLWVGRDSTAIYYEQTDEADEGGPDEPAEETKEPAKPAPAPAAAPAPVPAAHVAHVASAAVAEGPPSALTFLKTLLALRLNKPFDSIKGDDTIKNLVGGKSALQNELVGDIEAEFGAGAAGDDLADGSIAKIAERVQPKYAKVGKTASGLISKLVSTKMPGGFGMRQIKQHLQSAFGLGELRTSALLLRGVSMEPPNRLSTPAEANGWLDSVASVYAQESGLSLGSASAAPAASMAVSVAAPAQAQSIPDEPTTPLLVLQTLLALKLKKPISAIAPSATIKELVGGKSALQNELVGDISKEFGKEPDNAAEMDLAALASSLGSGYSCPGSVISSHITRLLNSKMPGGFTQSSVNAYLSSLGFGPQRTVSVLVFSLSAEPKQRLANESEAQSWLETVAGQYCSANGVSMSRASPGAQGGGGGAMVVQDSGAVKRLKENVEDLIREQLVAYYSFLQEDRLASEKARESEAELRIRAEAELAAVTQELGDSFLQGIKPIFDSKKVRRFDSFWAWVVQDCLSLYYDYATGEVTQWTNVIRDRLYHIKNRATSDLSSMTTYYQKKAKEDGHEEIVKFIAILTETIEAVVNDLPLYRELTPPTKPSLTVEKTGKITYDEGVRRGVRNMVEYVKEMRSGMSIASLQSTEKSVDLSQLQERLEEIKKTSLESLKSISGLEELLKDAFESLSKVSVNDRLPYLFIRSRSPTQGANCVDSELTEIYMDALLSQADEGINFTGKTALVTGCGPDSIGFEIVKALLRGGARVYATTSRTSSAKTYEFFRLAYDRFGGKGSELVILPFNGGSAQDVKSLVRFIYEEEKADIDLIVPFAAVSETGADIGNIGSRNELAHRIMLTNVIRLFGEIRNRKESHAIVTRPAHIILPLSPNHGIFGFDGLYAESKLGLEALLNKWKSEGWSQYLSLAGAIIGWTRGTGLMNQNNIVAEKIESLGPRTFNSKEMCFNLIGLMHPTMIGVALKEPIVADLNGGLHLIQDLNSVVSELRSEISQQSSICKAVTEDFRLDKEVTDGLVQGQQPPITPRANIRVHFPELPSKSRIEQLSARVKGMVDLENVVVITGFGEVGPFGSSRTRWEMESYGEFSLEGCIELAWMMNLIRYSNDPNSGWTGWVDSATGSPVQDYEIKPKYEKTILAHTGIRVVEPELFDGYNPDRKTFLHQVALNHDMTPIEVTAEEAERYRLEHGEQVDIYTEDGTLYAVFKKGTVLYIPRALRFDRWVAGQIPSTWDPKVLGIPDDIITQVDRVTLFSLVSCVEALVASGVTDPYEFYQYVHVSEVANTIGGGMGGMQSIRAGYRSRFLEEQVQGDVLQEMFINTVPAWLNMLLLSASGPVRTPVGACATAVESLDLGIEAIRSGKARIAVVGGYDDFHEEGSYEFAQMKATVNCDEDAAAGREPREMSRPATSTRAGFVESQGAGVQILMSASLAIRMGTPIYAIVESVSTAMDKEGRSVPAPGQGILTTAKESHARCIRPRVLNTEYRRRQIESELESLSSWEEKERLHLMEYVKEEHAALVQEADATGVVPETIEQVYQSAEEQLLHEVKRRRTVIYNTWGNGFYRNNPDIAPLRGALAVWGLSVDDVNLASFHGTSTQGNDLNESEVLQKQLEHLGRTVGNPIITIFQKHLTGHPKGAAAAWMCNGLVQAILQGLVPGNRNADNIDAALRQFDQLSFVNRPVQSYGFKAGLLKSFGFGQVGGEVLIIHPDYVLAQLNEKQLQQYSTDRLARLQKAFRYMQDSITGKLPFVRVKDAPPYAPQDMQRVYLDPLARAQFDSKRGSWVFSSRWTRVDDSERDRPTPHRRTASAFGLGGGVRRAKTEALTQLEVTMMEMGEGMRTGADRGIGVDAQLISEIEVSISNSEFLQRNYTEAEIRYCRNSPDPPASFAGRWAAKEAVIKAISSCDMDRTTRSLWKGASAPLRSIEVLPGGTGAPKVRLYGHSQEVANVLGIAHIKVTISHSGEYAVAQCHAY